MSKVAVAIPHKGHVNPLLYRALFTLQDKLTPQGYEFVYMELEAAGVAHARNQFVKAAIDSGVDLIHFVDDDIVLPPNAWQLYEHTTAPIVAGLYFTRQPPHTPQLYTRSQRPENEGKYWPLFDYPIDTLVEVDAVGAGCMLVHIEVFEFLEKLKNDQDRVVADAIAAGVPPVQATYMTYGLQLSPWFEYLDYRGEDFYFCERARGAGYRILCDTRVKCIHMAEVGITEQYYQEAKVRGYISYPPSAERT
jgi:hypothetical protein